jgi:three-Cys-motif partner protein
MDTYLQPQSDDLEMRSVKSWAAEKLDYLTRYLAMFTISMRGKSWRALNYIDLFAGPGKCREENGTVSLGSPLLALTAPKPFDHYFFVDLDTKNIEALRQRCQSSPYADRIQYFVEDCNVVVQHIVEGIQYEDSCYLPGRWPCLNLAFLDPEGLEVRWETIRTLAQSRTDLIIHYSQMGLQRYMPIVVDDSGDTIIDRFFGDRTWRDIYHHYAGTPRAYSELLRFYKQNLSALGYAEVKSEDEVWRVPLMRNTKNAPLYRLIFASKHPLGEKLWREVTNRDVYGQQRLF